MISGKLKASVLVFVWFEIRSNAFSQKLDASTSCGAGKLPHVCCKPQKLPDIIPVPGSEANVGSAAPRSLGERDGGKLWGKLG